MEIEELMAIAKPIVQRRGRKAGFSKDDCQDLLQDVLAKYLRAWPNTIAPKNVGAWFETATSNAIIDRHRLAGRRRADNFADGGDDPVSLAIAALSSPRFASAPAISREVLDNVFALIPPEDARLLRQRYLKNDAAAELAKELGVSVATLDQRTTRAKRKLREALAGRTDLVEELRAPHPHVY